MASPFSAFRDNEQRRYNNGAESQGGYASSYWNRQPIPAAIDRWETCLAANPSAYDDLTTATVRATTWPTTTRENSQSIERRRVSAPSIFPPPRPTVPSFPLKTPAFPLPRPELVNIEFQPLHAPANETVLPSYRSLSLDLEARRSNTNQPAESPSYTPNSPSYRCSVPFINKPNPPSSLTPKSPKYEPNSPSYRPALDQSEPRQTLPFIPLVPSVPTQSTPGSPICEPNSPSYRPTHRVPTRFCRGGTPYPHPQRTRQVPRPRQLTDAVDVAPQANPDAELSFMSDGTGDLPERHEAYSMSRQEALE